MPRHVRSQAVDLERQVGELPLPSEQNPSWTDAEDELLKAKVREIGRSWTAIAKVFDGKSENNVKNMWHLRAKEERLKTEKFPSITSLSRCWWFIRW